MNTAELITNIFSKLCGELNHNELNQNFEYLGIESIDLVTARVQIENRLNKRIPDNEWLEFTSIEDIIKFLLKDTSDQEVSVTKKEITDLEKEYTINMPQMAIEALSESWLFKESGDNHWEMLCKGLETNSYDLRDSLDNRLYATFVRIRLYIPNALSSFTENLHVKMTGNISRFGESMYFSKIQLGADDAFVEADLMTTFSIRNDSDNKRLTKSQPKPGNNKIEENDELPLFGNEYRLIKKKQLTNLEHQGYKFYITDDFVFETSYELSPYHDLNGVGLLYFAAYPIINDICEARFFNDKKDFRWELEYFTAFKDVLYYGNCNLDDSIVYKLNYFEELDNKTIKNVSSLYRKSDNNLMARIFTIKKRRT